MRKAKTWFFIFLTIIAFTLLATACDDKGGGSTGGNGNAVDPGGDEGNENNEKYAETYNYALKILNVYENSRIIIIPAEKKYLSEMDLDNVDGLTELIYALIPARNTDSTASVLKAKALYFSNDSTAQAYFDELDSESKLMLGNKVFLNFSDDARTQIDAAAPISVAGNVTNYTNVLLNNGFFVSLSKDSMIAQTNCTFMLGGGKSAKALGSIINSSSIPEFTDLSYNVAVNFYTDNASALAALDLFDELTLDEDKNAYYDEDAPNGMNKIYFKVAENMFYQCRYDVYNALRNGGFITSPELNEYTVNFYDGDTLLKTEIVNYGSKAIAPVVKKVGYTFKGWDKDYSSIKENLNINAVWQINTYTVNFFDSDTLLKSNTVNYGESANAPIVTKEGYTFKGWDKDYSSIKENLNINAVWQINTYTVKFYDGDTLLKIETVNYGESATAPDITKPGYLVLWDKDFSHVSSDLSVIAQFEIKNISIKLYLRKTIDDYGNYNQYILQETLTTNIEKDYKLGNIPEPNYDKKEGWFLGWYVNSTAFDEINRPYLSLKTFTSDAAIYGDILTYSSLYEYNIDNDYATITDVKKYWKQMIIPETIGGYPVKAIADNTFLNYTELQDITIRAPLVSIGNRAFKNCGISYIKIPETVKTIGIESFANTKITTLNLSDNIESVGNLAFAFCTNLQDVIIGDINKMGEGIFFGCTNLAVINCKLESEPTSWDSKWAIKSQTEIEGLYFQRKHNIQWAYTE